MAALVVFMLQLTLVVVLGAVICLILGMLDAIMLDGAVFGKISDTLYKILK